MKTITISDECLELMRQEAEEALEACLNIIGNPNVSKPESLKQEALLYREFVRACDVEKN